MPDLPLPDVETLSDLLHYRAGHQPEQLAYTFLRDGETDAVRLTYQELAQQVGAIAAHLQVHCSLGERAVLLYPPGLDYLTAFFGCLEAGVIAVPAYPPRPNRSLERLEVILADCAARLVLTTQSIWANLQTQGLSPGWEQLNWLMTDGSPLPATPSWQPPPINRESLAFLQYTSGSTAAPKGVMINHGNLLHNLALIHHCFQHSAQSRGVIWLPPYHDMGLIGGILQPLYGGFPVTLMSPLMFLQSPLRWLQAISRDRATTSGGPNFAYDLCVRKIKPEQCSTLDLSSWQVAFNGAEPINPEVLHRFATQFAPCGFRPEAFYPCYGMAEATLIVSGGHVAAPPVIKTVQEQGLTQHRAIAAAPSESGTRTLVGCGQTLPNHSLQIVNPETLALCEPGEVGEIWVSGPSIAQGYWQQSEATEKIFRACLSDRPETPFLRTGDLGFLDQGELFVTGRLKDLIIINGRNHYPQDIEWTVEQSHPWLQPSGTAAFSVEIEGAERLIVLAELDRRGLIAYRQAVTSSESKSPTQMPVPSPENSDVVRQIQRAVFKHHELPVYELLLLKPGSLPKTSSGKIQRYSCRAKFMAGTLALQSIAV
jgi:acyl-CoA synthetase (AMP-forming)/AMP-acid ligase II